jgi:hypothetical protein
MSLFAIADIHLSFGVKNKDMSIFKGWGEHEERLRENWNRLVRYDDTVVIAGDVSWGMNMRESLPDFEFISAGLNGFKIIVKGNHDYWWGTVSAMRAFLRANEIDNIDFLHNNSFIAENISICGTRSCFEDDKLLRREAGRLETSVKSAKSGEIAVFLHYPPIYAYEENEYILDVLKRYSIKRVFSGHIHSSGINQAFIGEKYGIYFDMISADSMGFTPKRI